MTKSSSGILNFFEYLFSVCSLVHISQAITPLLLTKGANEGDGVSITTVDLSTNARISILIYLVTLVLLAIRWKRATAAFLENKLLWVLIIIFCFSCFWSIDPGKTLRFSIYAIGTTAFGLYLATRYTLDEQLKLIGWAYSILLILSILFVVAIPKYGVMAGVHEGAFRGVFTHKNQFGAFMAPAGVIFWLNALRGERYSWVYWSLLAISCGTMILSQSTTALGTYAVMLLLCFTYRILRWRYEVMISAILGVTIVGLAFLIYISGYVDSLLGSAGKDITLSGRTLIWQAVWDQILVHPWLGYGLAAFWNGVEGPSAYIQLAVGIPVIYAHNGFLDLWLSVGLLGLVAFLIGFFSTGIQSLDLLRQTNTPEGFWPLLFLTYILLSNLTEGTFNNFSGSFWAIYTATSYSLVMAKNNKYTISE